MYFFIIFIIKLITSTSSTRVTSLCGHPGLPPEGTLYQVNSGRIRFHDGEEVRYFCKTNFQTYPQTRKCVSGRWVGESARCGVAIDNDIKIVKVYNCSNNKSTNGEILNLKLTQSRNTLRFKNSFHANRVRTGPITVYGSSCYLWQFKLQRPSLLPFLTLDFATQITHKDLFNANNSSLFKYDSQILTITPYVSPYRTCRLAKKLNHLKSDPINNATYLLIAYYFRCDIITESDYNSEIQHMSDVITVETRANFARDVNLVAVFAANHQINQKTGIAECGRPETVQTGANFRETSLDISQYQYQCNDSFVDVSPHKQRDSAYWYSVNCSVNGQWVGQFPACIPRIQCPGLDSLEAEKDPSVIIESIENVYFVNTTHWVAGEHSQVNYACVSQDHIVVGKLSRSCLKDGNWSGQIPKCTAFLKPGSLNTVATNPWTIIITLTAILVVFLLFVMLFVRKYVSNVRRELTRNRTKSRQKSNSIYTDILNNTISYDDDYDNNYIAIDRINRYTVKTRNDIQKFKSEEYNDLKGTHTEPAYTAILHPLSK